MEPSAEQQQQQPKQRTNGNGIDSVKRKMILDWIKNTQESGYSQPAKVSLFAPPPLLKRFMILDRSEVLHLL